MPAFTRDIIKKAFLELLEEIPYNQITVKKLVEKCGINRNSFYYHFEDIPSLMEEIIREQFDEIVKKYPSNDSIVAGINAIIDTFTQKKRAVMHLYRSMKRETFEKYLMDTCEYFVTCYADNTIRQGDIDGLIRENRELIINYYKCVCFGLMIDWLESGMKEEKARSLHVIFKLRVMTAENIADALRGQVE